MRLLSVSAFLLLAGNVFGRLLSSISEVEDKNYDFVIVGGESCLFWVSWNF
jgi:hypothetical protein